MSPEHLRTVLAYHERSKHQLQRYAAGPETLDWDAQPSPFRRYAGCPVTPLPWQGNGPEHPAWQPGLATLAALPRPIDRDNLALLLELSLALAAWKTQGPDRWAVRINPSSGNLHPLEGWLLCHQVPGLGDGLHHYRPEDHALELRAAAPERAPAGPPQVWLALSSLVWREAWKYGERAFRYVQLDAGHALAALRSAAAVLGWRLDAVPMDGATLAALLGLDRADFGQAERDEPEQLLALRPADQSPGVPPWPPAWPPETCWRGRANRLDPRPMYRWPVIDEVTRASRPAAPAHPSALAEVSATPQTSDADLPGADLAPLPAAPLARLIRQRRSAQRFDARARGRPEQLWPLLAACLPHGGPFGSTEAHVHLLLFVHRVDGLAPGAYLLARSVDGEARLRGQLDARLDWARVPQAPAPLRLWRLAEHPALPGALRTMNCHQALGSDAIVGLALLAEFQGLTAASAYRERLVEAGEIGQALYLAAEAVGWSGTGIGCFFDDELHRLIGLQWLAADQATLQSVYHFTVGVAVPDTRVSTTAPYAFSAGARDA